jgi:transcription antitermination protein NusB
LQNSSLSIEFLAMVSRRNIRIKAMQSIYALLNSTEDWNATVGTKMLVQNYQEACNLTIAYLYIPKLICDYAVTDAHNKANKHLPSAEDLNVNTKMSKNLVLDKIAQNSTFEKAVADARLAQNIDPDYIKRVYVYVTSTEEYKKYIGTMAHNEQEDQTFFLFLIKLISADENYNTAISEIFGNHEDDSLMCIQWIEKNFNKLTSSNFGKLLSGEKHEFGIELLRTFLDRYAYTSELIKPKLVNWDSERIAMLDMIIMQLGLTEILYFESIPCKVSINEYIDIAKNYSTMQSGNFVNGVLDKIYKELNAENKIHKIEFAKK